MTVIRGQGLRPPEGSHRDLPRRRVHRRLRAQGQDRDRRRRRLSPTRPRRPSSTAARTEQDRRRQDLHLRLRGRGAHPHRRARSRGALARVEDYLAQRNALIASAPPGTSSASDSRSDRRGRPGSRPGGLVAHRGPLGARRAGRLGRGCAATGKRPRHPRALRRTRRALSRSSRPSSTRCGTRGSKVGHQVRSPKQQLQAMREDLKTCTATLTARPLAGDDRVGRADPLGRASTDARKRSRTTARIARGTTATGLPLPARTRPQGGRGRAA